MIYIPCIFLQGLDSWRVALRVAVRVAVSVAVMSSAQFGATCPLRTGITRHYAMDELQWNPISGAFCIMLQCGAVSCSVLQCVAVCYTGSRAITT